MIDKDGQDESTSCLNQILALSRRSDSIHVKSEGARVLVNVIRSLCSNMGDLQAAGRQEAINAVVTAANAATLAQLLGRSQKHGILLNEAIVAMCLLSLRKEGGKLTRICEVRITNKLSNSWLRSRCPHSRTAQRSLSFSTE